MHSLVMPVFLLVAAPAAESAPKWKFNDANYESDLSDAVFYAMDNFHADTLVDAEKAAVFNRLNTAACAWDVTNYGAKIQQTKYSADLNQLVEWIMRWKDAGVLALHNTDEVLADDEEGFVKDRVVFWTIIEFCKYRWANLQQQPLSFANKLTLAWKMFDKATQLKLLALIQKSNRGEPGVKTSSGTAVKSPTKVTKKTTQ